MGVHVGKRARVPGCKSLKKCKLRDYGSGARAPSRAFQHASCETWAVLGRLLQLSTPHRIIQSTQAIHLFYTSQHVRRPAQH
jgi:hypothetical protein